MRKAKRFLQKTHLDAWQQIEYKHTTALLLFLLAFILILDTAIFTTVMGVITSAGYAGAFLAGIFFPSLFTFAPATTAIVILAGSGLNPVVVALIAGAGAMFGDYIILKFFEEKVAYELKPIALKFGIPQFISYLQYKRKTNWMVRVLGAFFIASPLPDELGIGMLGISKISNFWFFAVCYLLNAGGILALVLLGQTVF